MAAAADRKGSRDAERDDAADASRFFSRIGYLVLAVGAPVGVVLHPLGLYVMFSIGVGLILIAAALDAEPGFSHASGGLFTFRRFSPCWRDWFGRRYRFCGRPIQSRRRNSCSNSVSCSSRQCWRCRRPRERGRDRPLPLPIGVMAGIAAMIARALGEMLTKRRTMAGSPPALSLSPFCCSRRLCDLRRAAATAWRGSF
jgi:hypothetical protein